MRSVGHRVGLSDYNRVTLTCVTGMLSVLVLVKRLEKRLVSTTYFLSQGKYKRLRRILLHMNSDFLGVSPFSAAIFTLPANLCFFSVF